LDSRLISNVCTNSFFFFFMVNYQKKPLCHQVTGYYPQPQQHLSIAYISIFLVVLGGLLLGVTSTAWAKPHNDQLLEYRIKAVYLYNFIRFIKNKEKPYGQISSPIKICILGRDPFKTATTLIATKKLRGRAIQISRISSGESVDHCQVVFVCESEKDNLKNILSKLKHTGILTVGDMPHFAKQGGIIGFVIKRKKVRLEINLNAANREGLKISANLLEVATIIKMGGH
jgi:hypothetical protein